MGDEAGGDAVVARDRLLEQGVTARVRTVQRAVKERPRRMNAQALATVRFETPAGEEMQGDPGEERMGIGGERGRGLFFVAVLSSSRRTFAKVLGSGRQEEWLPVSSMFSVLERELAVLAQFPRAREATKRPRARSASRKSALSRSKGSRRTSSRP